MAHACRLDSSLRKLSHFTRFVVVCMAACCAAREVIPGSGALGAVSVLQLIWQTEFVPQISCKLPVVATYLTSNPADKLYDHFRRILALSLTISKFCYCLMKKHKKSHRIGFTLCENNKRWQSVNQLQLIWQTEFVAQISCRLPVAATYLTDGR